MQSTNLTAALCLLLPKQAANSARCCAGIEGSKAERDASLTPSHAAHKRKRQDFSQASSGSLASLPSTPPALTAFYQGANLPAAASLVGQSVTGHVDAKFDCGYFVSISVEGHEFKGGHAWSVVLNAAGACAGILQVPLLDDVAGHLGWCW